MRKALSFFGTAALMCVTPAALAATQDTLPPLEEQVIEEQSNLKALRLVQDYMTNVRSLKASFLQRAPGNNLSRGTLYMERPGRIRFDFKDDIPFLVVADGKSINFVDYEIGQVQKWPVKDTPMLAIIGEGFDLASVNAHIELAPGGIENLLSLAARDPDRPEVGEITVYFEQIPTTGTADAPGLSLLSWVVLDATGKATTVEIYDQEINPELAPSLWTFDDPRGLSKRRRIRR